MKIGVTASSFAPYHAGHAQMLRECKRHCDYLIVCFQTDPSVDRPEKSRPVQTVLERFLILDSIKYIDRIVPYDTEEDLYNFLASEKIDIRFIGDEYMLKDYTGKELDIEMFFNSRRHKWSSTDMRKRYKEVK